MKYAEELNATTLGQLAEGDLDAIWVRGFHSPERCRAVLPRVVAACERSHYTLTADFQSIGTSIGEAAESAAGERRYLDTAAETRDLIRDVIFAGRLSPLDELRLRLDELWPDGATVARHEGRPMLPGIIRRWPAGGHANPHIDQRAIPLLADQHLQRRIGTNVYLEVPPGGSGGHVDFWGRWTDEDEYDSRRRADYGLDRGALGEPHWSCEPTQGDLLMFDAARVHSVRRVDRGARATAACFVGVRAPGQPLVLFA
ncbi:2OG-Fe(II) oxygenase [Micromonospora soli]|uniref:2OG-Fe(II) oxygenase n=1 Tax=Micromonospora sp. NBRC 110009 TaxID=3061627 RepID=UPI00267415D7|nr:2OG-Fe(II) oxygenase [Micromonospora sp. NBRC 110009]WKU02024.1 2OG-Fe(II) oxygenase [Micromonospora sp. NBRC 110009]